MKKIALIIVLILGLAFVLLVNKKEDFLKLADIQKNIGEKISHPLSIEAMRQKDYPGSDFKIEQELVGGGNYKQYVASYSSEGLKIYGLLTVPTSEKPSSGYPAIIFNHGYIPPEQYVTTERYIAYVDYFARAGYIVFKPDYRAHGNSEGEPLGAYYSPAYTIDVLNALSSIKKYINVDKEKIGMWGHSMGGNIALRSIVVNTRDIKAAVIWGGVVGSYYDLMNNWRRSTPFTPTQREVTARGKLRQMMIDQYGTPDKNPEFWNSIDPTYFLSDINTPVQLHTGLADETVPHEFSESLYDKLKKAEKVTEIYTYPGDDHNISNNFSLAMQRSLSFFDKYLK